ncbi:sulfatase family protein [Flavobacterium luteum]|uniref:Sulfatase n=1 Tax=Flavobacterium luteum TaxID=2026654 RepID=A0A7J5AD56_9FLAO|nr:sulfatase [Flavobacterium luteum]KAB1155475.1 sulfatase [Flavobacterium luteum]
MKKSFYLLAYSLFLMVFFLRSADGKAQNKRPNILVIMGDDISRNSMGVYGSKYINTPNFDRIANEGALFTNAYVCNPKCSPSRACFLTGRYSWQLEEAANHIPVMPAKWKFYPELLEKSGYAIGFTGKGWGPGVYYGEHNPAGWEFNDISLTPPYKGISKQDYASNFEAFLTKRDTEKPFCFWFGTHEAHRKYEKDSYKKENKDLSKVTVQAFFPDNELVRGDLADYGVEVEYHDRQIGLALASLEKRGLLDNTIIIATSDQGMPFPHVKGQIYDEDFHEAFVVRWGDKIIPGRVVTDYINFPDVAPTIMEAAGLKPDKQMTGKSFLDALLSEKSGRIDEKRSYSLIGKERHDNGTSDGNQIAVSYPVRAIRTDKYLYCHNYKPDRWPVGDPEFNYNNCDDSPTKSYLTSLKEGDKDYNYFSLSFGKRPADELFDLEKDPDCVNNLASDLQYAFLIKELKAKMETDLKKQKDPRILGKGDIFDYYPQIREEKIKKLYKDKYYNMFDKFFEVFGKKTVPVPAGFVEKDGEN